MMRILAQNEADVYLRSIGMKIDEWARPTDASDHKVSTRATEKLDAPSDGKELFVLSLHVAGWLPAGDWWLLQIDKSTSLSIDEASIISALLMGPGSNRKISSFGSVLIEPSHESFSQLLISHLVFLLLLFEAHGHVVSSRSTDGQMISLEDGVVYLTSRNDDMSAASDCLGAFCRAPLSLPEWVVKLNDET